jgi:L-alanine-DL-glutamate epimerase-like enolase superfamily enzyme
MTGSYHVPIASVRTWRCTFPLPRPFRLGRATISEREYVIVRVEDGDGRHGTAFGLTRGAPTDVVVAELLAPAMIAGGPAPAARPTTGAPGWRAALPHHAPEGLVLRAASLLDVARWDLDGKVAGAPVWRLLGKTRDAVPVMLVEGYAVQGEPDEAFAERIAAAAAEGFGLIKLANLADDPDRMTRRLERVRSMVGPAVGLTVDIGYAWDDHDSAVALARRWRELDLAWIEDPLHGHEVERIARLRAEIDTPFGVGDEVTSAATLRALAARGAADVLRVDATCAGGIGGASELLAGLDLPASTHIYPEIHRHLAFAHPGAGPVEAFRPDTPWDAPQAFSAPPATELDTGSGRRVMRPPADAGLGLRIDWERLDRHATRRLSASGEPRTARLSARGRRRPS